MLLSGRRDTLQLRPLPGKSWEITKACELPLNSLVYLARSIHGCCVIVVLLAVIIIPSVVQALPNELHLCSLECHLPLPVWLEVFTEYSPSELSNET